MNDLAKKPQPSASDVAKYLLTQKGTMTGYQIQKLLYYCQAWSLVINRKPLFSDEIQAWEHGPVVPAVSRQHQNRRKVHLSDISGNAAAVSFEDGRLIDAVLRAYGSMTGDDLESLTHGEEPWLNAFNGHTGSGSAVITLESMRRYYAALSAAGDAVQREHCVPIFDNPKTLYVEDSDFAWLQSFLAE